MKSIIISVALGLAMVGGGVWASQTVSAKAEFVQTEQGTSRIADDKVVDGSAYVAGNDVAVSGTIKGDLYCAGNTIRIDAVVEGDVICAGNNLTIGGKVKGDVRAAGATVTIDGQIDGNASLAAADIVVSKSGQFGGDVTATSSSLTIDGVVKRDLVAGAEKLTINGEISRNIKANISNLTIADNAKVGGELDYTSQNEAKIPNGVVLGETKFSENTTNKNGAEQSVATVVLSSLVFVLMIGLVAVVGSAILPQFAHSTGSVSWKNFWIAVVVGLTFVLLVPLFALLLLLSVAGSLLGYALVLVWLLAMALTPVSFAYFIGSKTMSKNPSSNVMVKATVGALILMALLLLPGINIIVFMLMIFAGVGLMLIHFPQIRKHHDEKPIINKASK